MDRMQISCQRMPLEDSELLLNFVGQKLSVVTTMEVISNEKEITWPLLMKETNLKQYVTPEDFRKLLLTNRDAKMLLQKDFEIRKREALKEFKEEFGFIPDC